MFPEESKRRYKRLALNDYIEDEDDYVNPIEVCKTAKLPTWSFLSVELRRIRFGIDNERATSRDHNHKANTAKFETSDVYGWLDNDETNDNDDFSSKDYSFFAVFQKQDFQ